MALNERESNVNRRKMSDACKRLFRYTALLENHKIYPTWTWLILTDSQRKRLIGFHAMNSSWPRQYFWAKYVKSLLQLRDVYVCLYVWVHVYICVRVWARMFMCMRHCVNEKSIIITHFSYLKAKQLKIRRPGTNPRSKKMVKTPDLGKNVIWWISNQFMAKTKKSAWKYRIQSLKIAKWSIFIYFLYQKLGL